MAELAASLLPSVGRRLSEEDFAGDPAPVCVVSHPDAGGECPKPAAFEVYGLVFCEEHGLEAYHGALARFYHEAWIEFERLDNPHVPSLHSGFMEVLHSASKNVNEECHQHEQEHTRAAMEAYPVPEDRVLPETRVWSPALTRSSGYALPPDEFLGAYWRVCGFMLDAHQNRIPRLVEALEPLREHLAAQYVFADVIMEQKVAAWNASKDG